MQVWPLSFQFSPWAWHLLNGSSCTNTNTALLPPTSFPSFPLEWFLKYFFGKGKKDPASSEQTKTHMQKPKPPCLFESQAACRATVTYTLPSVTQRKTEHVFNCKAKWFCMGPVMLVRTCSSPALPLLPAETALPKLCLRVVTGKTWSLAGIWGVSVNLSEVSPELNISADLLPLVNYGFSS